MTTDWNNLRPWNGSREKGFEELCSQVAAGETYPPGSTFVRKGTPDGGVECYWTLPGGDEHAWQAKFFTTPPTAGQWGQIDDSVQTSLGTHPRLTRYTVCLPIDRSDARQNGKASLLDRWNDRVVKWKRWTAGRRMQVDFVYWGDHELTIRLSDEANRGRHWFWFNRDQFTADWFRKKLKVAIENAGERYTPQLHVDLPIARHFAALGRTPGFSEVLNRLYQRVRETGSRFATSTLPAELQELADKAKAAVATLSDFFDAVLVPLHDPARLASPVVVRWEAMNQVAQPLEAQLREASSSLWTQVRERDRSRGLEDGARPSGRAYEEAAAHCREFQHAVSDLVEYCDSAEASVASRPALLLVGDAGQGKTHLLCDIAEKDLLEKRPRILLHGSHFSDGEPWGQIARELGLGCTADAFVGALEAAGRAYGCRLLILIDALNEGEGRTLWEKHLPGMLSELAGNPWLGIAVSVRSSYEELVIPKGLVPARLTRVVHTGFHEHEYEAVNRFFTHYGIQPTTPLLAPEFTNPLFLKLFCQGIKANGWTRVPLGLRGITAILSMFLEAVNGKLWRPERMNYDRESNPVRKAVDALVHRMAESGSYQLPRGEAVAAVDAVHPTGGYDRSLFRNLVAEGVLAENRWRIEDGYTEVVSFAYERFADHLLAKYLLDTSLDLGRPQKAFGPRGKIGKLLRSEAEWSYHAGLVEALSIQLPERAGWELYELAPHVAQFHVVYQGFLKSLVWRDTDAFTEATLSRINHLLMQREPGYEILNAMLTMAPVPDHPLNAEKLHAILSPLPMAKRDAWWSVFLHDEWQTQQAVNRLIDWTWGESDKSGLPDAVVLLTGLTLAWFLTTSNRFLRDRATKALVKLFENRLHSFRPLLSRFWSIEEPYVLERLLAAGYGCAMRSQDTKGLAELAADVSKQVFQEGMILPQLLTRDYARGIVECARHRGSVPSDAFPESSPPYESKWPNVRIPAARTLAQWGARREDMPEEEWSQAALYSSVMGDGLSDFSRYVVGDLSGWTSVRLGTEPPKTVKDQYDEFRAQLKPAQRRALALFQISTERIPFWLWMSAEDREKHFGHPVTDEQLRDALASADEAVTASLQKTPALASLFEKVIKPYIQNPHGYRLPYPVDGRLARRWMVQRVIDYGWTAELFGHFDREVNRWRHAGRQASKPERIGKKYQWIAYHELLARLSDNFYMRQDRFAHEGLKVYTGPWDVGSGRDIDPSVIIRTTQGDRELAGQTWWSPAMYAGWHTPGDNAAWLRAVEDLPSLPPLLSVRHPRDGSEWYVLDSFRQWKEPAKPGHKDFERPQRHLWHIIRSYLVRRADAAAFFRWAKRQHFMGRWMPEPRDVYHVCLGEFFWAPAYQETMRGYSEKVWTRGSFDRVPVEVLVTTVDFVHESSGFDCSIDETLRLRLPAEPLATGMRLRWGGIEGRYLDSAGRLAAFDPSATERGPGALLVRQETLKAYLADNNLELFWTVLGEKQLVGGLAHNSDPGWLEIDAVYRVTSRGMVGQCRPEYRVAARERAPARGRRRRDS